MAENQPARKQWHVVFGYWRLGDNWAPPTSALPRLQAWCVANLDNHNGYECFFHFRKRVSIHKLCEVLFPGMARDVFVSSDMQATCLRYEACDHSHPTECWQRVEHRSGSRCGYKPHKPYTFIGFYYDNGHMPDSWDLDLYSQSL